MYKIISFFSSTRLMAVLFIVFAAAMGIGTFIEDAYNTETARVFIYNAWWFEAIMLVFMLNFFGNIKRYGLHKKEKWATLLLHLSFILIIFGAFITRYISYEGMMPIREGATESHFYSDKAFLTVMVDGEYGGETMRRTFEKPLLMSSKEFPLLANNNFSIEEDFNTIPFEIAYKEFILGAKDTVVPDPKGTQYIKLVEQSMGSRRDHFLKEGEVQNINNILFAFNKPTAGAININKDGENYTLAAPFEGSFMRMIDQMQGRVAQDSVQPLMFRSLYRLGGAMFVLPDHAINGKQVFKSNGDFKTKEDNALVVTIKSQGQEKEITLLGGREKIGVPVAVTIGKLDFTLMYGSKTYELPFSIGLKDFIANRYPGMQGAQGGYSSYESKVTLTDTEKKEKFDTRIYMNHVLDYRGYRFFQSGFDPDEQGTKLSVNHDFWGTWISYIGYFFLYIGLMVILIDKNTRFGDLKRKIDKIHEKKKSLAAVVLLLVGFGGYSQEHVHTEEEHAHEHTQAQTDNHLHIKPTDAELDSLFAKYKVSEAHAEKFGRIIMQDDGRMKPMNTMSSEILRKISKKETFRGMNADQTLLAMATMNQMFWYEVPIIYLKRGNDSLRSMAGLDKSAEYAAMSDFFDERGNYKLGKILDDAAQKREMNQFDKDFKDVNERIVLLNLTLSGQMFRVLPVPNDKGNKWVSYAEAVGDSIKGMDTIRNIVPYYFSSLGAAVQSNDYKTADDILNSLTKYQKKFGAAVMPSERKRDFEIFYNKVNIFEKLFQYYLYAGLLMLLLAIIKIFNNRKGIIISIKVFEGIIWFLFALHTAGLIARWYISGHAPWTNAYESVVYVAWATMFFGLALGAGLTPGFAFGVGPGVVVKLLSKISFIKDYVNRRSELVVASAAFVASIVLMVAHFSYMDPEIANLQPVLNSYWLMIHVAVIVASYGPFTLGMVLGIVCLLLMLFTNDKNKIKLELNIKELTYVNEMALTVGLVMLSIGNFLGGQWANESWGRYWGWDPKETWALVSIMVYAFVIHMRFVPALRNIWIYNFFSVLAYFSILMTYFGVNFYLTGLHSYATGEKRTPDQFYIMALCACLLGGIAWHKYNKHLKKKKVKA